MFKNIAVIGVGIIVLVIMFAMGLKSQLAQVIAITYLIGVIIADIIEMLIPHIKGSK